MDDVQKKIALRRLLRNNITEAPRDLVPEDWVSSQDMNLYDRMGSDTTQGNRSNLRRIESDLAEEHLSADSSDEESISDLDRYREDLSNQKMTDNLRYAKLKEFLNRK